jgi:hypothetical protein
MAHAGEKRTDFLKTRSIGQQVKLVAPGVHSYCVKAKSEHG